MLAFTIIWIGQVISLLGTAMTGFALTIWAWQITGQATALALVGFFTFAPTLLVTPFAGALVDRWNRKFVMMISDLAAIVSTTVVFLLFWTGNLQIWHLYLTGAFSGAFGAFQFPAYSAAVTTMVSKEQYGRASGMLSTAQFASNIFAPVMAAIFLGIIGIAGILAIDMFTFLIAIGALLAVHVPQPAITQEGQKSKGSLWKESVYGFRYIRERPSLLALLLVFFCVNLVAPFAFTLLSPMLLARTGNDAAALGIVQSAIGIGGLVGGVVLSIWGGPKRKIHGILGGLILVTLGMMLIGLGRSPLIWVLIAFFMIFFVPIINGSSQAIWQTKVAPDVQGRVFAARGMIAQIGAPVAMLLAGPLADQVFEPAMTLGGSWVPIFGWLVGSGPGAGMALMFVISGALGMLVGFGGYAIPIVRNVEDILADHVIEVEPSDRREPEDFPDKSDS
ncbi:MAG: MFS transporter [Candidatus Bathyarchaeota archaeon]|nr:MAG: MFS transporter [Candidatus Bathyarchaeota archaeon]